MKENLETRISEINGEIEYKCKCCGSWEFDVSTDGECQPCWYFATHPEPMNININYAFLCYLVVIIHLFNDLTFIPLAYIQTMKISIRIMRQGFS